MVKEDRGNIILGNPDGFDHVDCDKAAYRELPSEVVKEKPAVISKEIKKDDSPSLASGDLAPIMEQKEEKVKYTKPIKRGGRDSIFKRRLS